MQVKVLKISKGKTQKGADKTGLFDGNAWYNVLGIHEVAGQTVELEKASFGKDWYEIKNLVGGKVPSEPSGKGNGAHAWVEFETVARSAHALALELEPDGVGADYPTIDRSTARAAIVNTMVIAFSNGKIALGDDDIPF